MVMASRASSSCARGLLAGDDGLKPNLGASLRHRQPNAGVLLEGGKRQDLTPMSDSWSGWRLKARPVPEGLTPRGDPDA